MNGPAALRHGPGGYDDPVGLLERAVGYARMSLADVRADLLDVPTPCAAWSLADLLDHLADALDAFTEASRGTVAIRPTRTAGPRVAVLREKANALLAAWSAPAADTARIGDADLPARTLLGAAALELTVHGWDVGRATGAGGPIPTSLARDLLPLAGVLVATAEGTARFGDRVPVSPRAPADRQLLGLVGREPLASLPSQGFLGRK